MERRSAGLADVGTTAQVTLNKDIPHGAAGEPDLFMFRSAHDSHQVRPEVALYLRLVRPADPDVLVGVADGHGLAGGVPGLPARVDERSGNSWCCPPSSEPGSFGSPPGSACPPRSSSSTGWLRRSNWCRETLPRRATAPGPAARRSPLRTRVARPARRPRKPRSGSQRGHTRTRSSPNLILLPSAQQHWGWPGTLALAAQFGWPVPAKLGRVLPQRFAVNAALACDTLGPDARINRSVTGRLRCPKPVLHPRQNPAPARGNSRAPRAS